MVLIIILNYYVLTNTLLQINKDFTEVRGFCCHLDTFMGVHLVGIKSLSSINGCIDVVWLADLEVGEDEFDTFEISSTLSMIDADNCIGEISFEIKNDSIFDSYFCSKKVYNYFLERCGFNEKG